MSFKRPTVRGVIDEIRLLTNQEQLDANPEKQRAVVRSLEIVGEAARNIPDPVRKKYPDIEWRKITGMRDRLIHGYGGVNLRVVWETVKDNLPILVQQIQRVLSEGESED